MRYFVPLILAALLPLSSLATNPVPQHETTTRYAVSKGKKTKKPKKQHKTPKSKRSHGAKKAKSAR